MAASHFLSVSDVASLAAVEPEGPPVIQQYDRLIARLDQEAPDLAASFAEPVMASGQNAAQQIGCYSRHDGPVVTFPDLPAAERAAADAPVTPFGRLRPLLSDRTFGPFLGHRLVIPRREDVVFVGAGASTDDQSVARIFNAILGRFAGYRQPACQLAPPPAPPAAAGAAVAALPGGRARVGPVARRSTGARFRPRTRARTG